MSKHLESILAHACREGSGADRDVALEHAGVGALHLVGRAVAEVHGSGCIDGTVYGLISHKGEAYIWILLN